MIPRNVKPGDVLRVVRDSDDLGLDRDMRAHVVRVRGGLLDLHVPALDMTIASVWVGHADLAVCARTVRP